MHFGYAYGLHYKKETILIVKDEYLLLASRSNQVKLALAQCQNHIQKLDQIKMF